MKWGLVAIWVSIIGISGWLYYDYTRGSLLFPNSDFESGTLLNWTATGDAFNGQPVKSANLEKRRGTAVFARGTYLVGTFEETPLRGRGDVFTGTLESARFVIGANHIVFKMGAGDGTPQESVQLIVDNQVVRQAVGSGKATNSESLSQVVWDVAQWRGKQATIRINDLAKTGWGHLNVDDLRFR